MKQDKDTLEKEDLLIIYLGTNFGKSLELPKHRCPQSHGVETQTSEDVASATGTVVSFVG